MTKYREILRLQSLGFSERNIAQSCGVSRNTVAKVLKKAAEINISWPLDFDMTDSALEELMFPKDKSVTNKRMPDFDYIRKELLRNGVNKKLLWVEYCEECRMSNEEPLMYSQFCYYIQKDEEKRRATMHIPRKPGEQIEVDWAGDPAHIFDPDTGEITEAWIFVGVLTYSQYAFVKAYMNEKTSNWIKAHVQMFDFFGGVTPMLVSDNCTTAVNHEKSDWYTTSLNTTYHEMAEVDVKKLMAKVEAALEKGDVEGAKTICRNTRGPVASICYQGLMRIDEGVDVVERSVVSYGGVQAGYLEKGCSWITLFIAMAPSLGFLGTVIGMVMAFDNIQRAGDISPTVVAGGMKVALITTIFGLIVALILQVFYNYILSKIEAITSQMEDSSITLLDMIMKYNLKYKK